MDKKIELSELYEIYKPLISDKAQAIFEMYINFDLSLREIGKEKNITYQAVRDSIKRTEKEIYDLESKLKVYSLKQELNNLRGKNNV